MPVRPPWCYLLEPLQVGGWCSGTPDLHVVVESARGEDRTARVRLQHVGLQISTRQTVITCTGLQISTHQTLITYTGLQISTRQTVITCTGLQISTRQTLITYTGLQISTRQTLITCTGLQISTRQMLITFTGLQISTRQTVITCTGLQIHWSTSASVYTLSLRQRGVQIGSKFTVFSHFVVGIQTAKKIGISVAFVSCNVDVREVASQSV